MATDALMNEQIYPCEVASRSALDKLLLQYRGDISLLKDFLCEVKPEHIN